MELDKNKVLVGMSGGVDSSVAAAMLKEQGFDVIGLTITPFKIDQDCRIIENERSCCNYSSVMDAHEICTQLGISHLLTDLTEVFREKIVENFIGEYLAGRTPNPCVTCNYVIKWDELLKYADKLGAYYVATGHYAKVRFDNDLSRYVMSKGKDGNKDQAYFLWKLSQEQLSRTLFPLGDLNKSETRILAENYRLKVSQKPDSQEICFIPKNDYRAFVESNLPEGYQIREGKIVRDGEEVGSHKGIHLFTIGQRKGLGVSSSEPMYVKSINSVSNTVEIAAVDMLYNSGLIAKSANLQKYAKINENIKYNVKVRYRDSGESAYYKQIDDDRFKVEFDSKRRSITPGQSVVIYEGDDLVGGGIIESVF